LVTNVNSEHTTSSETSSGWNRLKLHLSALASLHFFVKCNHRWLLRLIFTASYRGLSWNRSFLEKIPLTNSHNRSSIDKNCSRLLLYPQISIKEETIINLFFKYRTTYVTRDETRRKIYWRRSLFHISFLIPTLAPLSQSAHHKTQTRPTEQWTCFARDTLWL